MSSHLLSVQFCNNAVLFQMKIFDSDWVVFTKNIINEVVRVIVVMAVDYPIFCGPCTIINILLFSGNKNNVITCHLLIHLGMYVVSQSLWQMYSYEQLLSANCALWKKWYRNFGVIDTKSTLLCKKNIQNKKKKKLDTAPNAGQKEIKTICYSGIRNGLTLPWTSEATFVLHHEFLLFLC